MKNSNALWIFGLFIGFIIHGMMLTQHGKDIKKLNTQIEELRDDLNQTIFAIGSKE